MASLTETAYHTRRLINWAIAGLIGYFILRLVWGVFITTYLTFFPPKPPPPNHAFGKLPSLKFPESSTPSATLNFKLETIEGRMPTASTSAAVYFMPKKPANLLALTQTQEFVQRLGFNPTPIQESKNIYRFNDPEITLRTLRYDIVSDNFSLRYTFEQDPGLFADKNLPFADAAESEALSILQTYNRYLADFVGGRIVVSFLRFTNAQLASTPSFSQADAVRVDFFRRNVGNTRVVTPLPNQGPISLIFSGSRMSKKRLLHFIYNYWPIDYEIFATYSLKTTQQAWTELQNSQGYLARYPTNSNNITIRNIYLAYYDTYDPQTYLQPVFVFEGDDGFLAYVSAINPSWTE